MKKQNLNRTPEGTHDREVMGGLTVDRGTPSGAFILKERGDLNGRQSTSKE
jgi:hypothetical protein